MKKLFPLLIITLLTISSVAQNYRCINTETIHYFEDDYSIKAINVDSAFAVGNNLEYYNYPTFSFDDEEYCYSQFGPSWIGHKMTEMPNGDNIFYNLDGDQITIKTLADVDEDWTCYEFESGDYITAKVTELQSMEFLGITDMVKKITFQAKDANGAQISHPVNNMYLLLSENYGLVRIINFKVFPDIYDNTWYDQCHEYELSGIEGNETGILNLTKEQIFNMNIGDEFHTEKVSNSWAGTYYDRDLMLYSIISKELTSGNDTLKYLAERCGKKEKLEDTVVTFYYYSDTVEFTYALEDYSYLDTIVDNIIVEGNNEYREYSYNSQQKQFNGNRMTKTIWYGFHSFTPHDCIELMIIADKNPGYEYKYFVEGLGGPYWNNMDPYWTNFHKILYYKTATDEWGEPLNCDSLMVNINDATLSELDFQLAPNPMTKKSVLKFKNPNADVCTLILFDLYGNQVKQLSTTGEEIILEKENIADGIYVYSLFIENRNVHSGKLIVQ